MANPYDVTRTNLFRVTDADAFQALMAQADCGGSNLYLFLDDAPLVGFGCYDSLWGFKAEDDDMEDDDDRLAPFLQALSELIAPGSACILVTAHHERLRSVGAYGYIVTRDTVESLSFLKLLTRRAKELLANPDWNDHLNE